MTVEDQKAQDVEVQDQEDEEEERPRRAVRAVEDLGDIGWSEVDRAVNVRCQIADQATKSGTTDVAPTVKFRADLDGELLVELGDLIGQQALTVRFAGVLAGSGGELKTFRAFADADGSRFIEGTIRFPSNQVQHTIQMGLFVRKAGILALEPDQLSFDLTARAE